MEVTALTATIRENRKIDRNIQGVVVQNLIPRTPAVTLSLQIGDVITAINDTAIKSVADFFRLLNDTKTSSLQFTVHRNGQTLTTLALVRK